MQTPPEPNSLQQFFSRTFKLTPETLFYIVIFLIAIFTRFHMLGDRVMSHDESLHTRFSYNLYNEGDYRHTPLMHGPVLFHAVSFFYYIFGDNDYTARIYTSILGVLMVMTPLLFRRWLGRWGTMLACLMLLISPLIMYYNRYIREDTPNLFYSILMVWSIFMYLNGPESQRRRERWLYLLAGSMLLSLASKESALIYIAIFGIFLALYWFARLLQYFTNIAGKTVFYLTMMGILFGGVLALFFYCLLDIVKFDLFPTDGSALFSALAPADQTTFLVWAAIAILSIVLIIAGTMMWAFSGRESKAPWREVLYVVGVAMAVSLVFIVVEERSHTTSLIVNETAAPPDPNNPTTALAAESTMKWFPMLAAWGVFIATAVFLYWVRRRPEVEGKDKYGRGFWGTLDLFPEFDLMIIIGTLVLPWATAIIPYMMKGTAADYTNIASGLPPIVYSMIDNFPDMNTPEQIGQVWVSFLAWLPLMGTAILIGLAWNWRKWLIASAIFHALFAFFFTTVFTNINGLATGMIYSLGYWLEQQSVRRGSQPQYYYLMVILPMYEFLPIIGSILAMFGGSIYFWRWRKHDQTVVEELALATGRLQASELEAGVESTKAEVRRASKTAAVITAGDQDEESVSDEPLHLEEIIRLRQERNLHELPFLFFWAWLAILNLIGYTLAGEKMPWLGVHMAFPMIFLAAWFFGRIFDRLKWTERVRSYGPVALVILIVTIIVGLQVFGALGVGRGPFQGLAKTQLEQTYNWLASAVMFVGGLGVLAYLVPRIEFANVRRLAAVAAFGLLALITFRASWIASFVNYDSAREFLVYAHSAPAVKQVLDQITELSLRTTNGMDMKFAYDNSVSWPYSWYFRHFRNAVFVGENPTLQNLENAVVVVVGDDKRSTVEPLLEDQYVAYEYIRMWWPMQEYFNVTPDRLDNLFDFSPSNANAAQLREGLFDIWWNRDYTVYGVATSKDFAETKWPVSDKMLVYVRKDIAREVWEYGVGDGEVFAPTEQAVNLCRVNWDQEKSAVSILSGSDVPLSRPLGLSFDAEGNLYVAEEFGYRVSVFNANGEFVRSIGTQGNATDSVQFTRPNSVAVAPDGSFYVADTWNYRILHISADGSEVLTSWGQPNEAGFSASTQPTDGFWGPRDVAVDAQNRVYVSDTGNKRIRVYDLTSGTPTFLYDLGSGGSGPGQLNEPNDVLVHPVDGRVFVADTWNRRVSVFSKDGTYLNSFLVRAWYDTNSSLPYMALDASRDLLYVGDPNAGRVLVFNTAGECVGSFGNLVEDTTTVTTSQFNVVSGIAVDVEGNVYVADAGLNRILKFTPFAPLNEMPEGMQMPDGVVLDENGKPVLSEELNPLATVEASVETTAEDVSVEEAAE